MDRSIYRDRKLKIPERSTGRLTSPQPKQPSQTVSHMEQKQSIEQEQSIKPKAVKKSVEPITRPQPKPSYKKLKAKVPSNVHLQTRKKSPKKSQNSDRARLNRYLSKTAKKSDLLAKSLDISDKKQNKLLEKQSFFSKVRSLFSKYAFSGLAVAVLIVAGYISVDTWLTNRQVTDEVMASSSGDDASHQEREGTDETPVTDDSLNSYKVAADLPRAIYIDKIDVKARVLPMGVNTDGSMQSPINIFDAGWYSSSSKPGEVGAVVVDAHASGRLREGLFAYIDKMTVGDTIVIEKGDGNKLNYRVIYTEEVPLDQVDMKKLLLPYGSSTRGLNLITCSGSYVKESATYDHRTIVYAEQV